MGEVRGEEVVHSAIKELLFKLGIQDKIWVHVLWQQARVFSNVSAIRSVP